MSHSIIQYVIYDPTSKQILQNTQLHGYASDNKTVYRHSFTDDWTRVLLMNKPQAQERLTTMQKEHYVIAGGSDIRVETLEIKKMEVSYLLLE